MGSTLLPRTKHAHTTPGPNTQQKGTLKALRGSSEEEVEDEI